MGEDLKPYIKTLIQLRTDRGLTQAQLGQIIGVRQQTIANWETGQRQLSVDMLIRLCLFYQKSLDEVCQFNLGRIRTDGKRKDKV